MPRDEGFSFYPFRFYTSMTLHDEGFTLLCHATH